MEDKSERIYTIDQRIDGLLLTSEINVAQMETEIQEVEVYREILIDTE